MRASFLLLALAMGCPPATSETGKDSDLPADVDGDGHTADEDCDDGDGTVYVGAPELCDGLDNDCDSVVDNDATDALVYYKDADSDGFGDPGQPVSACAAPEGHVAQAGDCDDADADWNPDAPEDDCTDPNDYNCDGSVGYQDGDGDGVAACEDCDDADDDVFPGAEELCNGTDDDCDGDIDGGALDAGTWYQDDDGDGYGTAATIAACTMPEGYARYGEDCDDADNNYHPGAPETDCTDPNDYNCDGSVGYADNDGDGYAACEECDDAEASHHPGADEYCDGADDDCDGTVDENDALDASTWYADADNDSYGDAATSEIACDLPVGYTADASDCDDSDAAEFPGAEERCDGDDDDCDGEADEDSAVDASTWYADSDSDSYGDAASPVISCAAPAGHVADASDCDDSDDAEFPGADERCDGDDDDCDGAVDEDSAVDAATWYADSDGDTYGDAAVTAVACTAPGGFVAHTSDCDDVDAGVNPGADEACNGVDDNCDGDVDEATAADAQPWYADADGDGFGDASVVQVACEVPVGYAALDTDCDDADATEHPGADERCDGDDDDCDGEADEDGAIDVATWYRDGDADGYGDAASTDVDCAQPTGFVSDATDCDDSAAGTNPGQVEQCDAANVDEDCSGAADDADSGAVGQATWYADADGDGHGDAGVAVSLCDQPASTVADATDCDDTDAGDHPGATETVGNADDEDCDGGELCFVDADSDGYRELSGGSTASADTDCDDAGEGTLAEPATDCDDADATENPAAAERCDGDDDDCDGVVDEADALDAATWYADSDGDGYGDLAVSELACAQPSGFVSDATDCDDGAVGVNPAAVEVCDAADTDEDCSGQADDDDAGVTGRSTWYADTDGDGYGDPAVSSLACEQPASHVLDDGDCDDGDLAINPAATEVCDAADTDEDCSGTADDADPGAVGQSSFWLDADDDAFGDAAHGLSACDWSPGYSVYDSDCDDTDAAEYPGALEYCDGDDDDCDLAVDEAGAVDEVTWYADADADTYGDPAVSAAACDQPAGFVANSGDCDDAEALAWTGATEVCDSVDNDCNGLTDDGATPTTWYGDLDEDGYGDPAETTSSCSQPAGYVADSSDCDDLEDTVHPGATEVCDDGVDQNCETDCRDEEVVSLASGVTYTGVNGTTATSSFGSKLVGGVDFNGDAIADFAVGDRLYDASSSLSNMGRVTIFLGTGSGFTDTVSNPSMTLTGSDAAGRFGQGLAAGDIDGDGIDDLIAGTPAVNGLGGGSTALTDNGKASVFLGPLDRTAGATTAVASSTADCVIEGAAARSYLGTSVSYGGDLTGDGTADWVYGAHQSYTGMLVGYVGIVNTGSCSTMVSNNAAIHTITGSTGDVFGHSVLGDVDLDGDGHDDLLVSAAAADSVFLFLGPVSATSRTGADATVTGMDFYYSTSGPEDNYGDRLASIGDTDGDGYAEFLVGASSYDVGANASAGAAFLIPGDLALAAGTDLATNLATVQVFGGATTFNVGAGVAAAGDTDADGEDDFIVSFGADTYSSVTYGAAALFYGGATGSYSPSLSATPSGYAMYQMETTTTSVSGTGGGAAGLGDVDGDGFDDFLLADMNFGTTRVGKLYMVYGTGE